MPIPRTAETREYANFSDNGDGTTSRHVKIRGGLASLIQGIEFDAITASYPNSTTEVYQYRVGGAGGTIVATVTVTYTNASKENILSAVRS